MKVLVVVDMQKDFVTGALGSESACAILPKVADKISSFEGRIAVTHDTHMPEYMDTQEGKLLPVPHCIDCSDGWELCPEVKAALDAKAAEGTQIKVFKKPTFGSCKLGEWLCDVDRTYGIDEIVFVGVCTDICVISNALLAKAFLPEVKITVDASCCAGTSPENHANALKAMLPCQIFVENM